jgi:peroxiredoxin
VDILAVSADTEARASAMAKDYGLFRLAIGYEMPIDRARAMGVFISKREKDIEMPLFCEPATFLINNQSRVQAAWIASTAFARVLPDDILSYVDFLAKHSDRDPRGSS